MGVFTKKGRLCCGGCKSGSPVVCSNRAEAVPGGLKPTEKMAGSTLKVPSHSANARKRERKSRSRSQNLLGSNINMCFIPESSQVENKTPELSKMVFPRTLWTDKGLLRIPRVHPSEVALAETAGHKSTAPEALPSSECLKKNQSLYCFTFLEWGMAVYAATDNCPRKESPVLHDTVISFQNLGTDPQSLT